MCPIHASFVLCIVDAHSYTDAPICAFVTEEICKAFARCSKHLLGRFNSGAARSLPQGSMQHPLLAFRGLSKML